MNSPILTYFSALSFALPLFVLFFFLINHVDGNIPVTNLIFDLIIISSSSSYWLLFIKWFHNIDEDGNKIRDFEKVVSWRRWYYDGYEDPYQCN
tara:strand:- start:1032 stop:1313 length:282 start_codon:yes stop_codon:yes gene_type:complete